MDIARKHEEIVGEIGDVYRIAEEWKAKHASYRLPESRTYGSELRRWTKWSCSNDRWGLKVLIFAMSVSITSTNVACPVLRRAVVLKARYRFMEKEMN